MTEENKETQNAITPPPHRPLRFGIPSLDRLFYTHGATKSDAGIELWPEDRDETQDGDGYQQVSMCIIGPSGTGKSILGLHLASRYWADSGLWEDIREQQCKAEGANFQEFYPSVVYVSTDLGIARARETWKNFRLNFPNERKLPFNEGPIQLARIDDTNACAIIEKICKQHEDCRKWEVSLDEFDSDTDPSGGDHTRLLGIANYLTETKRDMGVDDKGKVAFVDLAAETAGDDWGYVSRIVKQLPTPEPKQPLHLIVIDAVEGLEMLVGDTDAYGQTRSRRSRVAQILRAASGKCHVVLILEEDAAHQHPVEEYVTDIVMRLRVTLEDAYLRRSIEVVKSRGHQLIRGEQNYVIRGGSREKSESEPECYPDDPKWGFSYFQLIRSLHSLSRVVMWENNSGRHAPGSARGSGADLALMTTPKFGKTLPARLQSHPRLSGLFCGKTTSLIGDEATHKSRLGRAFLAGAFDPGINRENSGLEAAVLITTFNLNRQQLTSNLACHWASYELDDPDSKDRVKRAESAAATRLVYRQLEAHHLNSSLLFHIIRRCVEHALALLEKDESSEIKKNLKTEGDRLWWERTKRAERVRVVIDDWHIIQTMYPAVAKDSLFLPFLIRYFESVGVTVLFISTQPGRPEEILSGTAEQTLRAVAHHHLYTWHVPFYGVDRVAISAVPPMDADRGVVGEIRPPTLANLSIVGEDEDGKNLKEKVRDERLWIDPHFELYKGLEKKDPQQVPLEVYLFSAASGFEIFAKAMNGLLTRLFTPASGSEVIVPQDRDDYASLRDFCSLHGGTYRDHTIVLQIDEYWKEAKVLSDDVDNYLEQRTFYPARNHPSETSDPYSMYQPPRYLLEGESPDKDPWCKERFFEPRGYVPQKNEREWAKQMNGKGVPYLWDFGFLLLRKNAWEAAMNHLGPLEDDPERKLIKRVWDGLAGCSKVDSSMPQGKSIRWLEFFEACRKVALFYNRPHREVFTPFDLDLISPQSFSCLVLEIWASELQLIDDAVGSKLRDTIFPRFRFSPGDDLGLDTILGDTSSTGMQYRLALFRAWILLSAVVDPKSVSSDQHRLLTRPAPLNTVAARHWYSTGSMVWKKVGGDNPVVPARLPGTASTRGDWFLMVGRESRSRRLGERAIDLLSRRRTNLDRLELGMGLPVRKLLKSSWNATERTNDYSEVITAMAMFEDDGRRRMMRYADLLKLGSTNDEDRFRWLWRSRLRDYHRHDRVWEHWLGRLVTETVKTMHFVRESHHIGPFDLYAMLNPNDIREAERTRDLKWDQAVTATQHLETRNDTCPAAWEADKKAALWNNVTKAWTSFNERCQHLVSELSQQATTSNSG